MSLPRCNAKLFNNLQELWRYCEKCLICQKGRKISFSVGPDGLFKLDNNSFSINNKSFSSIFEGSLNIKFNSQLKIKKEKWDMQFDIDALNNDLKFEIYPSETYPSAELNDDEGVYHSDSPYCYFYMNVNCTECNSHTSSTSDIELDFNNKKLLILA